MSTLLMPDVELLVFEYLRDHPDVDAIANGRVYRVTPANVGMEPFVRVHQFDSDNLVPNLQHFDAAFLQIDSYAGPQATASLLGRTVRAALQDLPGTYTGAVVTGAKTEGWRYQPDTTFDTARARFIVDLTVWVHPVPTGS